MVIIGEFYADNDREEHGPPECLDQILEAPCKLEGLFITNAFTTSCDSLDRRPTIVKKVESLQKKNNETFPYCVFKKITN